MKRVLLTLLMTAVLSAVAFAGPSINPWFEIGSEGIVAGNITAPTLEAGVSVEGSLSSAWFIDLGFTYDDLDLLNRTNPFTLGFEANIGFDQLATVNQTGSLVYGCSLSIASDATYKINQFPDQIKLRDRTTGFVLEGYVGPLTLWGGVDFPWDGTQWLDIVPTFGVRVDFEIGL